MSDFDRPKRSIFDWFTLDVTDLIRAVDQNDPGEVERALKARVNPNKRDGIRRIALPIAVNNNNIIIVRLLLGANASPNVLDESGESALYKAVFWDNEEIVKLLLSKGASPLFANSDGTTPLAEAQNSGNSRIVEILQSFANKKEAARVAREREKHQAIKERAASEKQRRLDVAAAAKAKAAADKQKAEQEETARVEKRYGMQTGGNLKALLRAMTKKDTKATRLFAERLDQLNVYDDGFKTTPLLLAVNFQNIKLANYLMEQGADPLYVPDELEESAFAKAVNLGMYEFVQAVVEKEDREKLSAMLNDSDQIMSPQLYCYKDARMLDLLLRAGADPYFGGKDMPSPIVKAIEKASLAILPVLVRNQVDLNQDTESMSLLEWAIRFQRIDWVNGLIDEGAEINALGEDGKTALMHAVEQNLTQVVNLLLEANANTAITSKDGKTALQIAEETDDREEIILLLQSEA
ncbi:MAG: ankyrin repeat domain-containing protein [Bacteroidota bacterium]